MKRERAKLAAVAIALVLLAAVMFSGSRIKNTTGPMPANDAPAWQSTGVRTHQPLPTWKEPMVALPPTTKTVLEWTASPQPLPTVAEPVMSQQSGATSARKQKMAPNIGADTSALPPAVGDRYSNYRMAEGGASLAEQARRESPAPARPIVRFDGTIEKQTPEMSYDGPRSSSY